MAIRKISDLPYLTEEQLLPTDETERAKIMGSSIEISYLSSIDKDAGTYTFVSRQMKFDAFKDQLLADIKYLDYDLSGNKFFHDGAMGDMLCANHLYVYRDANMSGDFKYNYKSGPNTYVASLNFGNVDISSSTGHIRLYPNAQVANTLSTDEESIVNYGFLRDFANDYFADLSARIEAKLLEWQALMDSMRVDYGQVWPVGSLYISYTPSTSCPIAGLKTGWTWQKIEGRYLLGSGTLVGTNESRTAGNTVGAGLPDHTHSYTYTGGTSDKGGDGKAVGSTQYLQNTGGASGSIYGASATVRPPAAVVDIWRRVS